MEKAFNCVECGRATPELYKKFPGGVIKVHNCEWCGSVVDKYVEFDPIIVILDAVLHKAPVYRHLLCNTHLQWASKLCFVLLFCDAYHKWEAVPHTQQTEVIVNAAMELHFYAMLFQAIIEWLVLLIVIFLLMSLSYRLGHIHTHKPSPLELLHVVCVSSFGKLLVLPASVWGLGQNAVCTALTRLLVFTSNNAALKAKYQLHPVLCMCVLGVAHMSQWGVRWAFTTFT